MDLTTAIRSLVKLEDQQVAIHLMLLRDRENPPSLDDARVAEFHGKLTFANPAGDWLVTGYADGHSAQITFKSEDLYGVNYNTRDKVPLLMLAW